MRILFLVKYGFRICFRLILRCRRFGHCFSFRLVIFIYCCFLPFPDLMYRHSCATLVIGMDSLFQCDARRALSAIFVRALVAFGHIPKFFSTADGFNLRILILIRFAMDYSLGGSFSVAF